VGGDVDVAVRRKGFVVGFVGAETLLFFLPFRIDGIHDGTRWNIGGLVGLLNLRLDVRVVRRGSGQVVDDARFDVA
jgi:hypothetical protein